MKKLTIVTLLLISSLNTFSQLPEPELWLFDLQVLKSNEIKISNPRNISNNKGYDSQPSFSPDGKCIYFTSVREGNQTDIYKYDLSTGEVSPFASTPESEYSPMVTPDGKGISCVRVEKDSTQRMWVLPFDGGAPYMIMPNVDSIGYYAWMGKDSLAIFVLTNPFTLQVVDVKTQKTQVIADSIGRCIQNRPKSNSISFTTKTKDSLNVFYELNKKTLRVALINICMGTCKIKDGEDYCWIDTDVLIRSYYSAIMQNGMKGSPLAWKNVEELSNLGIKKITRLAVSPDKKRLVVVAQ